MSIDEQDTVIGRLVREAAESRRKLVALQGEISRLSGVFSTLGTSLLDFIRDFERKEPSSRVNEFPSRDTIISLLREYQQEQERQQEMQARLKMAGL